MNCEVCHQPITAGQGYIHHQRLNVDVHWDCPRDDVRGEDISFHAVVWVPPTAQKAEPSAHTDTVTP